MKCYYVVEGYEDRLFEDDSDACDFIGDMQDFYTDEGLQQMCEEEIYEICGIVELADWCDHDEECIAQYEPNYIKLLKDIHEADEADEMNDILLEEKYANNDN